MEWKLEVFGLVAPLVDQALKEESDEVLTIEEADGMEGAAEVAEHGSELGKPIVDSIMYSVPVNEPTVPGSELETELETVDSSYHLHKIVQMVEVTRTMALTSRSSTCFPKGLASDKETWQDRSSLAALSDDHYA